MECPECKSKSLIAKDGGKRCDAKGCTYIQFHLITYENENRAFDGEKTTEDRFSYYSGPWYVQDRDASKSDRNFFRASNTIRDLIHAIHLSTDLQNRAEAKLIQILKIKYLENGEKKFFVSDTKLGAYCLWLACYDRGMKFKDVRIANEMGISKEEWGEIHRDMELHVKSVVSIPIMNPESNLRRICSKRKINKCEEEAMLEMMKRMRDAELLGGKKYTTIAAFVFWKIMERSSTYNSDGKFSIADYLNSRGTKRQPDGSFEYWTQREIDGTVQTIQNFASDPEVKKILLTLIPNFSTRMKEFDIKSTKKVYNYDIER